MTVAVIGSDWIVMVTVEFGTAVPVITVPAATVLFAGSVTIGLVLLEGDGLELALDEAEGLGEAAPPVPPEGAADGLGLATAPAGLGDGDGAPADAGDGDGLAAVAIIVIVEGCLEAIKSAVPSPFAPLEAFVFGPNVSVALPGALALNFKVATVPLPCGGLETCAPTEMVADPESLLIKGLASGVGRKEPGARDTRLSFWVS